MFTLLLAMPFLFSISPSSAPAGAPATTVTVEGRGFTPQTVARWNGRDRRTVFVSSRELRVTLRPSDLIAAEPGFVTVHDGATGTTSAGARLDIIAPEPDPAEARLFLLAPPVPVAAPAGLPAVYETDRAARANRPRRGPAAGSPAAVP